MMKEKTDLIVGSYILIVDDEESNLLLLKALLTKAGYIVQAAASAEEALQCIKTKHPALILLDIIMPGMTGYEVCQRLKSDKATKDIPVIFITAIKDECSLVKGYEAGCVDFIGKPFLNQEVLSRVKTHLTLNRNRFDLEMHEIELEMQNEELKLARDKAEESSAKFTALYDFAPAGHFTLDRNAKILELNRTGAKLLDKERNNLIGADFKMFVEQGSLPVLNAFIDKIFANKSKEYCEVRLALKEKPSTFLYLEGVVFNHKQKCLVSSIDITERKNVEKVLKENAEQINAINTTQAELLKPDIFENKLKVVTDSIVRIFKADFARIWMIRQGDRCESSCPHALVKDGPHVCRHRDQCLHLVSSSGRYTHIDGGIHARVPFGCYKIGCIASGEYSSFLTNNVAEDIRVHNHDWARELGLVSFAGFGLHSGTGKPIGVLALFSKNIITQKEYALLTGLSQWLTELLQLSQYETSLKESEKLFRVMFENAGVGVGILVSKTGKFIKVNKKYADFVGYTIEEMEKLSFQDITHPEDVQKNRDFIDHLLSGENTEYAMEKRYIHKNGSVVWGSLTISPLWNPEESPLYHIAIVQDITERKKAETSLKLFRTLLDQSFDSIEVLDPETGRFLDVNAKDCLDLGYTREEFLELRVFDIDPLVSQSNFPEVLESVRRSGALIWEGIHRRKDGSTFPVEVSIKYVVFDRNYLVAVVRDITERKKTEETLIKAAEEWKITFDSISDFIFVQDENYNIVKANKACADLLKLPVEEVIGKKCYELMHKTTKPLFGCQFEEAKKTKKPSTIEVEENSLGLFLQVTISPVFDKEGNFKGTVHYLKDITERKKQESELAKKVKDLEVFHKATVGREKRIIELKEQLRELKAKLGVGE